MVAYDLEFQAKLAALDPVFHISLLKKCVGDLAFVVPLESASVKKSIFYEDVPIDILDRHIRTLKNREIALVKVLWRSWSIEGATWETKAVMKPKYAHLFPSNSTPTWGNNST